MAIASQPASATSASNRKEWMQFSPRATHLMIGLLVAGEALGFGMWYLTRGSYQVLSDEFAKGSITLLFGALLGGIVTQLIAEVDRGRVRRAAQVDFISNVLSDLKSVYDGVDRGRTLIVAHQSVKTYGDEMRNVIEARVKLKTVVRALLSDERRVPILGVRDEVEEMEEYLKSLTDEFEANYKRLSRQQSIYEAAMKTAVDRVAAAQGEAEELPKNTPWDALVRLPALADLIKPWSHEAAQDPGTMSSPRHYATRYGRSFVQRLDAASQELREALIDELENRSRSNRDGDEMVRRRIGLRS